MIFLGSLKRIEKPKALLLFSLTVLAIAGAIYMYYIWTASMDAVTDQALKLAMTAEAGFQSIDKLEAKPKDIEKPEYKQIKSSLVKFVAINKDFRFAYIYKVIDGRIYIMADSEPVDSKDYSPPGQEYSEADDIYFSPFEGDGPIVTQPTKDRWGTWVSILVPMKDFVTGETVAVFGVDYPAKMWDDHAAVRTAQAGIVVMCLLLLLIAFYEGLIRNIALKDEKIKLALANEKLGEKEELFRTIYEQSPLGISFGNYNSDILDTNSMFEKIVGRSREELAVLSWTGITHPDDIQKDMDYFNKFNAGEINGYSMVKRYIKSDGSIVWANLTLTRLKVDNNPELNHLCIIEDISERIRAEEDLRESERSMAVLLSNLPGMAYRCNYDRDWTMQFVSEGCFDLTGYKPESLLHNRELTFNDLINLQYREFLWEKWTQLLAQKAVFREEYSITTASGEVKWVFEQGRGVYDENGEVIAIEGLIIDITERKKREDEIGYLNYHDVLTGLYNRRFFEEEKKRVDNRSSLPLSIIIGDIDGLKLINDALGHSEGDKLIVAMAKILDNCCRKEDILARTGGDEFSILLPETSNEDAYKIVKQIEMSCEEYKRKTMDEAHHVSISLGCATRSNANETLNSIMKDAEDSMYRHKLLQSKSLHSSIISSMKATLFEKSHETEAHAQRLIELSKIIGQKMNLTDEQLNELELLSALHDIGKIGINDNILNKPGRLTAEEWVEMKKHPEIGYRIAMSSPELTPIADYILCHHEHWDGKGYPQGLKREDIPLLSRILAVVDAYDAMTEDRSYRKAMAKEAAIDEIKRNAGTQFDPEIAKIFIEKISDGK
ncbi:MAG TPA: HD domain-containing phosphohydrolase [Clostridia bacterium]|nr:HD domain-containing phosphohydrolase [Clostridia bacterium]